MNYFDILCSSLCFLFCIVHVLVSLFSAKKTGKKIEKFCSQCLSPVYLGEEHKCNEKLKTILTEAQSRKLFGFLKSLNLGDVVLSSSQLDSLSSFLSSFSGDGDNVKEVK